RETLYGGLAAIRRSRLHGDVARALEELHGGDDERVFELAHHLYEAAPSGAADDALLSAVRAADVGMTKLAYEQAEHPLRRALQLVARTSGPERAERELDLQVRIGALLMMTKGYADPEVGEACARARALCRQVGNQTQLLSALWRLGVFYEVRAD